MKKSDRRIEKVYENYCTGTRHISNELLLSFLLAYHSYDDSTGFAFQVGSLREEDGLAPNVISPDIDILEVEYPGDKVNEQTNPETTRGYEVKARRPKGLTKNQLYNAIGQAQLLLTQPVDDEEAMLQYVSIAIPPTELDKEWLKALVKALQSTPIGMVVVGSDKVSEIVEPLENPFHSKSVEKEMIIELIANYNKTTNSPLTGIEELSSELLREFR